jgi:hypothetical protein
LFNWVEKKYQELYTYKGDIDLKLNIFSLEKNLFEPRTSKNKKVTAAQVRTFC